MYSIARSFVIFDQDIVYATALINYLSTNMNNTYQMQIVSEIELFIQYLEQNRIVFILVSQGYYEKVEDKLTSLMIPYAVLVEMKELISNPRHIYKYQAAKDIARQIEQCIHAGSSKDEKIVDTTTSLPSNIISIISPSSSLTNAMVGLATARYLSRQDNTLLINLDPISMVEDIMFQGTSKTLSDILYFYKQGRSDVIKAYEIIRRDENILYIPKVEHYSDLFYMDEKDLNKILEEVRKEYGCKHIVILLKNIDLLMEACIRQSTHIWIEKIPSSTNLGSETYKLGVMLNQTGLLQNKLSRYIDGFDQEQVIRYSQQLQSSLLFNEEMYAYISTLLEINEQEET